MNALFLAPTLATDAARRFWILRSESLATAGRQAGVEEEWQSGERRGKGGVRTAALTIGRGEIDADVVEDSIWPGLQGAVRAHTCAASGERGGPGSALPLEPSAPPTQDLPAHDAPSEDQTMLPERALERESPADEGEERVERSGGARSSERELSPSASGESEATSGVRRRVGE